MPCTVIKAGHTPNRKGTLRKGGQGGASSSLPPDASFHIPDDSLEGCSSFMTSATVFLRLIQSEMTLMKEVIPQFHHSHVLDSLIKQPVDFFISQGESLFQQARKNVTYHDYSVVISCLRLLRHIKALLPEYRQALQVNPFHSRPQLSIISCILCV